MYIKLTNGNPTIHTLGQLRRDNPNTSFPKRISDDILAEYDVYSLAVANDPTHNEQTHRVVMGDIKLVDSAWVHSKKLEVRSNVEEIIREERNKRLALTDYMALSDVALHPTVHHYRQQLRDVPEQDGFPMSVVWPVKDGDPL